MSTGLRVSIWLHVIVRACISITAGVETFGPDSPHLLGLRTCWDFQDCVFLKDFVSDLSLFCMFKILICSTEMSLGGLLHILLKRSKIRMKKKRG